MEQLARAAALDSGTVVPGVEGVDVDAFLEEARRVRRGASPAPHPADVRVVEVTRELQGPQGEPGPEGPPGPRGEDGITPEPVWEGTALAWRIGDTLTAFVELKGDKADGGSGLRASNAPAASGNSYWPQGW